MSEKTLLVVDDAALNRNILNAILSPFYRIIEAADGSEALDAMRAENGNIACVLLDIMMPVMDGFQVIEEMKREPMLADIPIIIVTAMDDTDSIVRAYDLGVDDLVVKPYDGRVICQRIKNLLHKRELADMKIENIVLRRQNQAQIQLKAILDNMIGGIALIELSDNMRALYLNDGFAGFLGRSDKETRAFRTNVFFNACGSDLPEIVDILQRASADRHPFSAEYRVYDKYGDTLWIHIQGVRIEYPESEFPVLIAIFSNISNVKRDEIKLRGSSLELKTLIDNLPCGVVAFEYSEHIKNIFFNDTIASMTGYSYEEYFELVSGKVEHFIYEEDLAAFRAAFAQNSLSNVPVTCSFRFVCRNSELKLLKMRAVRIGEMNGKPLFYAIFVD